MGPKSFYTFLGLLLFIQGTSKEGANLIVLYCTLLYLFCTQTRHRQLHYASFTIPEKGNQGFLFAFILC